MPGLPAGQVVPRLNSSKNKNRPEQTTRAEAFANQEVRRDAGEDRFDGEENRRVTGGGVLLRPHLKSVGRGGGGRLAVEAEKGNADDGRRKGCVVECAVLRTEARIAGLT
jgi:hypothetical protein